MPSLDLKILHVSSAKTWRGGERQLSFLVEGLAKKNILQAVLCPYGSAMEKWCAENKIPYFTYRKIFSLNPIVAMHIRWICRRLKITHLHAHDSHSHGFAVLSASLFWNPLPIIVHRRVDFPIGQNFLSRWKYNHPAVRKIICVSHFIKNLVSPVLENPGRAVVVHSGVDIEATHHLGAERTSRIHFGTHSPLIIGNIAAIAPHKDYFTFVRTAEILLSDGLSAKFQIIGGDGGEEVAVRNMIAEKKLTASIEMMGFRNDVPQLLSQMSLLLFTSKTEGLGTSLLDAMAAGVSIVATRTGGIPEMIEHEVTGLLAPVGDADELAKQVRRMLSDTALRENILANAKEKVKQFSKEKMAENIMANY